MCFGLVACCFKILSFGGSPLPSSWLRWTRWGWWLTSPKSGCSPASLLPIAGLLGVRRFGSMRTPQWSLRGPLKSCFYTCPVQNLLCKDRYTIVCAWSLWHRWLQILRLSWCTQCATAAARARGWYVDRLSCSASIGSRQWKQGDEPEIPKEQGK